MVNVGVGGRTIEGVDLFVFDRDGTLIDIYYYWSWMVAKRAELMCEAFGLGPAVKTSLMEAMGIDTSAKRIKPQGPVGIKKREIVMQAAVDCLKTAGVEGSDDTWEDIFRKVDKLSLENLDNIVRPIQGSRELLVKLKEHGCKCAIATTDRSERAKLVMNHMGIAKYIDVAVGADDVQNPKPAPDMIELICGKLGVAASKAVMIGDAESDIRMGLNAGTAASIGVASGISSRSELMKLTPYVIESVSGISIY